MKCNLPDLRRSEEDIESGAEEGETDKLQEEDRTTGPYTHSTSSSCEGRNGLTHTATFNMSENVENEADTDDETKMSTFRFRNVQVQFE